MALPLVSVRDITENEASPVKVGDTLDFQGTATDADGDLQDHWLEIQNPAQEWSWQGWLTTAPWIGGLQGDGSKSVKEASFTFPTAGLWRVRSTATDIPPTNPQGQANDQQWQVSNVLEIQVVDPTAPVTPVDPAPSSSVTVAGQTITFATGSVLEVDGHPIYTFALDGDYKIDITEPQDTGAGTVPTDPPATPTVDYGRPRDVESVSKSLGPTWAQLNPGVGFKRFSLPKPPTLFSDIPFQRAKNYTFGTPTETYNNFWSTTANVLYIPDGSIVDDPNFGTIDNGGSGDVGALRLQPYAAYNGVAASEPQGDYSGFAPDPVLKDYTPAKRAVGGAIGLFQALARSQGLETNEAWAWNAQGLGIPLGTQTSRGGDDWPLPQIMLPGWDVVANALTTNNEMQVVVGIERSTGNGLIAFFVMEGKYLPSHTMQRIGQPNEGSWSDIKLLGIKPLGFTPIGVCAASNGSWSGPSQTANEDLGQIDMSFSNIRAGLADDSEANAQWGMIFSEKGYACVIGMGADDGEAAFFDLAPILKFLKDSYLNPDDTAYAATLAAEDAGDFPPTFAENPAIDCPHVASLLVANPSFCLAVQKEGRWTQDYFKTYVGTRDGDLVMIDVSGLMAKYSWQYSDGIPRILGRVFVGKNITSIAFLRYNEAQADALLPLNQAGSAHQVADPLAQLLLVTCRGENALVWGVSNGGGFTPFRRVDGLDDPICSFVDERGYIVTTLCFRPKVAVQFCVGGISADDGKWYTLQTAETDVFEAGDELSLPGYPFLGNSANVN